jgi:hypothetical protein
MPRLHLLLVAAALLLGRPLLAQAPEAGSSAASPPIIGPGSTPDVQLTEIGIAPPDSHKASLLVAPIPFYNSQLGAGLVGMVGVLKRLGNEPTTPASALGTFGMITTNGTWGIGLGGRAHLGDDAWRTVVGGGYFDIRFQYYGTGGDNENSVDLRQTIVPIRVEALRRVTRGVYVGMQAQYAKVRTGVELDTAAYDLPPFDIEPRTSDELLLTPMFELDTRDDQFYPTRGWLLDASASFLSAKLASDSTMQRYDVLATWQHGWDEARNVLAAGLQACYASGEVPINHLCIVGALNGLRGYEPARYLDRTQVTLQAEYRRRLGRFGVTAFAGAAQIAPTPGELSTHDLLVAGGVGVRFRLTKQFPINYRADVAYGRDGVQLYFSVGEAF